MKYVGIKSCKEKRKAASRGGKLITVKTEDLVAGDCKRHLDYLEGNYRTYIIFHQNNGKSDEWIKKRMADFDALIESIKANGFDYSKGFIRVGESGVRVDGSHRASICHHLGIDTLQCLEVKMRLSSGIQKHLEEQRRAYC